MTLIQNLLDFGPSQVSGVPIRNACPSLPSAAVNSMSKATWGGKGIFHPTASSPLREVRAGTQDRNLEAGTEAETMEEHCLLVCSARLSQIYFHVIYNCFVLFCFFVVGGGFFGFLFFVCLFV